MENNNTVLNKYNRSELTLLCTSMLAHTGFYVCKNTFDSMLAKIQHLFLNHAFDYNPAFLDSFLKECPHFPKSDSFRCAIGSFIRPFYPDFPYKVSFKVSQYTYVLFLANLYAICNQTFTGNKHIFTNILSYVNYIDNFIDNFPFREIIYISQNTPEKKCAYKTEEINSFKLTLKTIFHKEYGADVYITYENFRAEINSCLKQTNAKNFYFMPSCSLAAFQPTFHYIDNVFDCWERVLFGNVHDKSFYEKALSFLNIIYDNLNIMKRETQSDCNILFDHLIPVSLCSLIGFNSESIKNNKNSQFESVDSIAEYSENKFNQLIDFYSAYGNYFFSSHHQDAFIHILKYCRDTLRPYLRRKVANTPNINIQTELLCFLKNINQQPMIEETQSPRKHINIPLSLKESGTFMPILEWYFSKENIYASIENLPVPSLNLIYTSSFNTASEITNLSVPISLMEWNQLAPEDQKKFLYELCTFSKSLIKKYLSSSDYINTSD